MAGARPGSWVFAVGRGAAGLAASALVAMGCLTVTVDRASALSIELKDVAEDRIERQRAAADGRLPLAQTPDIAHLTERLDEAGLKSKRQNIGPKGRTTIDAFSKPEVFW